MPANKKITIELSHKVHSLLKVLSSTGDVEEVIGNLVDHAQQGIYRPGAWEREWICQAFGYEWIKLMENGDPYGRPESHSGASPFQRPRRNT